MKKYSVTLLEHVRWTYEVEANNEQEAVDIATNKSTSEADRDGQYNGYEIELLEDGVDEEQLRKDFIDKIHSLVHKRYSFDKLQSTIREWSGIADLEIYEQCSHSTDECLGFSIEEHTLAGDYDIFFIRMRDGKRIYITEVGFEF